MYIRQRLCRANSRHGLHLQGESREIALDAVVIGQSREKCVVNLEGGELGGNEGADLAHDDEHGDLLEEGGLAGHIRLWQREDRVSIEEKVKKGKIGSLRKEC